MHHGVLTLGQYIRPYGAKEARHRPAVDALIFYNHTVWKVTAVVDVPIEGEDAERWIEKGMPDPATWHDRPYRVDVSYVGGARPAYATDDGVPDSQLIIPAVSRVNSWADWYIYPDGRWPACSCCGDPAPCRAELRDRQVAKDMKKLSNYADRVPGACWHCQEPITKRQESVLYTGINLDYPIGPQVMFHTRRACAYAAERYEKRWLAEDPDRARILTWPDCGGNLYVHQDGTSECSTDDHEDAVLLGFGSSSQAEGCQGHLTHNHAHIAACYIKPGGCDRGCSPENHPGVTPYPQRVRRR